MAVLPNVHGLGVRIIINGQPAEEFAPPVGSALNSDVGTCEVPKVHRFIESQSGEPYTIEVSFQRTFRFDLACDAVVVGATVDGALDFSRNFKKSDIQAMANYVDTFPFSSVEGPEKYGLTFTELPIAEDASRNTVETDLDRLKTLGTIKVMVHKARQVKIPITDPFRNVAQKALILNGGGHTHATRYLSGHTAHYTEIRKQAILGEFEFHYLSRQSLEARNIVPGVHQPLPTGRMDAGATASPRYNVIPLPGGRLCIDLTALDD